LRGGSFQDQMRGHYYNTDNVNNSSGSDQSNPEKFSLVVRGSVQPRDVPEEVASDGDQSGSQKTQKSEVGNGKVSIRVQVSQ